MVADIHLLAFRAEVTVSVGVPRVTGFGAVSWDRAPDRREIPARHGCRPWRHGSGVAGAGRAPQPRGSGEGAGLACTQFQGRAMGGPPPRDQGGAGSRRAEPPQRDPGLRHRGRRRLPVDRHGNPPSVLVAAGPDRAAGTARPRRRRPRSASASSPGCAPRTRWGHRAPGDVKPLNVVLAKDRVVLTDFGIARDSGPSALTTADVLIGSPSYIAPERAQGGQPGPAERPVGAGCVAVCGG